MSIFERCFFLSLGAILLCVQLLEVVQAEDPDCEDLHCLVCHANMDEADANPEQLFKSNFITTDLNLTHRALVLDRAPKALPLIRAPPRTGG